METLWLELALVAAAILANAFFAGSELALVVARPSRLAVLRDRSRRGAAAALALKRDPDTFLATIQIAITLVATLASAVGGAAAVDVLTPWLRTLPAPGATRWAEPVALGVVILVITYASLVIGELTPKSLALRSPERAACLVAPVIQRLIRLARWPGRALTASSRALLALLGQRDAPSAPLVSEDEVKYLLREGATQGVFEPAESELVHRVFRFTDTTARTIMVPRPNILALDVDVPPTEVLRRAVEFGRARIPVYRGSLDETLGVVLIKDLLRCAADGTPPVLSRLLHPAVFVPETARVTDLLREFQRSGRNLAMVVDEYGRTAGMVTIEDLLEEIVGEIREEHEGVGIDGVSRLPDGAYLVDGTTSVRDLRDRLGFPLEESPDYQTIAGLLLHRLQAVPKPGTTARIAGFAWTVVEMTGPRIVAVKAERVAPPASDVGR